MLFKKVNLDYLDRKLVLEGMPSRIRSVRPVKVSKEDAIRKTLKEAGRKILGISKRKLEVEGAKLFYYPYWIYVVEFAVRALPLWRLSKHESVLSVDGVNGHTTFADKPPSWEWKEVDGDELIKLFVDGRTADKLVDAELPKLAAVSLGGYIQSLKKKTKFLVYKPIWVVVAVEPQGKRAVAIVDAITWGVGVVWYPSDRELPEVFERARRA